MQFPKYSAIISVLMLISFSTSHAQHTLPPGHPYPVFPGQMHPFMPPAQNYMRMMNPFLYNHLMTIMSNPFIDQMTRHRTMESMMRAMDPRFYFGAPARIPGFPTQSEQNWTPNTVSEGVSAQAKRSAYQAMMMMSPLSMRDMIAIMAEKMPVADDVSFDDAVEAMKLRANEVNFKLVGHNAVWKDIVAITGKETPRVEIFQFCDAMVGRQILDYVPEFVIFLPCRISLLEDAQGKLWVMTMDWDVSWLDYAQNPNSQLTEGLKAEARRIRDNMRYIMEGAASGDF